MMLMRSIPQAVALHVPSCGIQPKHVNPYGWTFYGTCQRAYGASFDQLVGLLGGPLTVCCTDTGRTTEPRRCRGWRQATLCRRSTRRLGRRPARRRSCATPVSSRWATDSVWVWVRARVCLTLMVFKLIVGPAARWAGAQPAKCPHGGLSSAAGDPTPLCSPACGHDLPQQVRSVELCSANWAESQPVSERGFLGTALRYSDIGSQQAVWYLGCKSLPCFGAGHDGRLRF